MPTVPTLNGPQISQRPIDNGRMNVQYSPDTFGAPIAQSLGTVAKVYHQERENQRQVIVNEGRLDLEKRNEVRLYSEDGAMRTQGKQAFGITERTLQSFDADVAEISAKISDPVARRDFELYAQQSRTATAQHVDIHEGAQYREHDRNTFVATQEQIRSQAVREASDPQQVEMLIGWSDLDIQSYGKRNGMSQQEITQMRAEARSGTQAEAIIALSDSNNYLGANKRFAEVGDQLTPKHKANVQRVLEGGTVKGESQRYSAEIMAAMPDATLQELNAEAVKRVEDPKILDEVQQRLARNHAIALQSRAEKQENVYTGWYHKMNDQQNPLGYDAIPESERLRMSTEMNEALKRIDMAHASGQPIQTHFPTYASLMAMYRDDPTTFNGINLTLYADRLSLEDQQKLEGMKGKTDAVAKSNEAAVHKTANEQWMLSGLRGTNDRQTQANELDQLRFEYALRQMVEAASSGKAVPQAQIDKFAQELLTERLIKGKKTRQYAVPGFSQTIKPTTEAWTRDDTVAYTQALEDPGSAESAIRTLAAWGGGQNEYGTPDPVYRQRYEQVLNEYATPAEQQDIIDVFQNSPQKRDPKPEEMIDAALRLKRRKESAAAASEPVFGLRDALPMYLPRIGF
jgi:hypothetical protein